jgi:hypothetical protein
MSKNIAVTCVPSQHLPVRTEENHEIPQSEFPVSGPILEPGNSRQTKRSANPYIAKFSGSITGKPEVA